jgi:cytochrome c
VDRAGRQRRPHSEEWGASSTHGYRGSFLRIHPDNSAKGYSIPVGNFGDYFAKQTGNAQYLDTSKVLPEIYIKGTRNNYTMVLDPVRRWVLWGDVGPDVEDVKVREEDNLRKTPGFEGWPYFVGNNFKHSGDKNADAPTNTSHWNTGLTTLPPARPTFHLHTLGSAPITGPLYRYDGDLVSAGKFPPHFTRKWFMTDYGSSTVNVMTLDSMGEAVTASQRIFANHTFSGPVDFQAGPDGALYIVNYGNVNFATVGATSIERISYKGTCAPSTPKLEKIPDVAIRGSGMPGRDGLLVNLGSNHSILVPQGMAGFQLFDLAGKRVWDAGHLKSGTSFRLPAELHAGALKYRWVPASI